MRATGPLGAVVDEHHGYRQRGVAPARHLGLPSPFLTVIFTLDEPLRIARQVDPAQPPGAYETLVGGLHTSPAVIEHDGSQSGIQLQLSPLGARALLGVPAGVLVGIDVCGSELLGARASEVREQLCEAASWPTRFQVLDRELGRHFAGDRRPPAEVCQAWRMLRRSSGTASIARVAREVGWSDRRPSHPIRSGPSAAPAPHRRDGRSGLWLRRPGPPRPRVRYVYRPEPHSLAGRRSRKSSSQRGGEQSDLAP